MLQAPERFSRLMQLAGRPLDLIGLGVAITGTVDDSAGAAKELPTAAHHM